MTDFGEDSDDDSDGEGGLGNVNRLIMRPAGHSGKAKRGHLCFDAAFETGNLGRVDLVNDYEYDLYIRPDTCGPKLRFWFHFTVDNVRLQQRVIFNIVNISKRRNLFGGNMAPLVRSATRVKWQRVPKRLVFYQRSRAHRNHYVLSFAFVFDKEDELYQFALTYPYGYTRSQTFLKHLEEKCTVELPESFQRECIGQSIQKRKLDLLRIGNLATEATSKRHVVAIIARVHPGEAPSSFICQGLIELLISSHAIATTLRQHILFVIIPMLNPDGVFLGNYRSTAVGADLNRMWNHASPFAHPTLISAIQQLQFYEKHKEYQVDFVIDIHANSSLLGSFIYGNSYDDVYRNERHALFPKLLANVSDDFDSRNSMYNACNTKSGTARRYCCANFSDKLNAYSYEVSLYGYKLKGTDIIVPYTEDAYKRCGRNLLKSFLQYYHLNDLIPINLTTEIKDKGRRRTRRYKTRPCNISSSRSSHTTRVTAPLHYTDIHMYYDSETSAEGGDQEPSTPLYSGKFTRRSRKSAPQPSPSPIVVILPPSEPCLSIIDFNMITEKELKC